MRNSGCSMLFLGVILIAAVSYAFQTVSGAISLVAIIALIALAVFLSARSTKAKDKDTLLAMADKLEAIGNDLKPIESTGGLSVKTGESVYFELQPVGLIEFRSTGSSYSGTSQGFSIPIVKGIRYRVGASRGNITRNPDQLTQVDTGKAIFTNQRIIFVGPNLTREWDLDKLVDMTPGPNGQTISISVSNRQKTSGLSSIGRDNITPGFYASIIQQLNGNGIEAAKKNALEIAQEIRDAFAKEAKN